MKRVTLFSWGYWGWGNATRQLVAAVDAAERARGFRPPIFVDCRIHRSVRANGFADDAFERLLGVSRYRWMRGLGNRSVANKGRFSRRIQIDKPGDAEGLLSLAIESARENRRVLFFCSCELQRNGASVKCHRYLVGSLILKAAKRRGQAVEIAEWPGGKPVHTVQVEVSPRIFKNILQGRTTIPLGNRISLATFASLPWCSIVTVHSGDRSVPVIAGPVRYQREWVLPVVGRPVLRGDKVFALRTDVTRLRRFLGYESRSK